MNLQLALLCMDTYTDNRRFDKWYDGTTTEGVCFGTKKYSDASFIAFEGSHDSEDWIRNFDVATTEDPILGTINAGQAIGLQAVVDAITAIIDKEEPVYVTGHSRGASYAIYVGARLINLGYRVYVAAFEPPRTMHMSSTKLAEIYKGYEILITKNGDDLVPDVPLGYLHPAPVTEINCPPVTLDETGRMAWHKWQLIVCAMASLEQGV